MSCYLGGTYWREDYKCTIATMKRNVSNSSRVLKLQLNSFKSRTRFLLFFLIKNDFIRQNELISVSFIFYY